MTVIASIDYLLMAELVGAFQSLENNHAWDLSTGEIASLLETFYPALALKMPETREELEALFERAYVHTWGADHECDKTKKGEMRTFVFCLMDSLADRDIGPSEYAQKLGVFP